MLEKTRSCRFTQFYVARVLYLYASSVQCLCNHCETDVWGLQQLLRGQSILMIPSIL
jgi:hypothetical protein